MSRLEFGHMAAGFGSQEPSIAAVVGSMDAAIAQYAAQVALQPHRLEVIQASPAPQIRLSGFSLSAFDPTRLAQRRNPNRVCP